AAPGTAYPPRGQIVDEKAVVNAVVGLHATGGSTNHTLHLVAVAAAAGIHLSWDDFSDLSEVVPLLARVYPNGNADVNHFQAAGGMAFCIGHRLARGWLADGVRHRSTAGRWAAARRRAHRGRRRSGPLPTGAIPGAGRFTGLATRTGRKPRPAGAAPDHRPCPRRRRAVRPARQPRPSGDQGVGGRAVASDGHGAGPGVR